MEKPVGREAIRGFFFVVHTPSHRAANHFQSAKWGFGPAITLADSQLPVRATAEVHALAYTGGQVNHRTLGRELQWAAADTKTLPFRISFRRAQDRRGTWVDTSERARETTKRPIQTRLFQVTFYGS